MKKDKPGKHISKMFPNTKGMYERYQSLKTTDPYRVIREEFARNYNRQSWKRKKDPADKQKDPNFGQFQAKINTAQNLFVDVVTERKMAVRIIPKYAPSGKRKAISDKLSAAFHSLYIKPWEDRFLIEAYCIRDMIMSGKGIEHWPTLGCFRTENVPVESVFPDTSAGLNTSSWGYVFIEKGWTVCELLSKYEEQEEAAEQENHNPDDDEFDQTFLKEIIDNLDQWTGEVSNTEANKMKEGENSGNRDRKVVIVTAYIKDFNDRKKPVSKYVFPERKKEPKSKTGQVNDDNDNMRMLYSKSAYCKCISEAVHVRCYQLERSYWRYNSFAKQIYFSTMLYDKSMSLVLRAAKRSMILYWQSADKKTQEKLMRQSDDEIQVVDDSTKYITTGQAVNIVPMVEAVRQVMIDTENSLGMAQAPGSQNVKGYAITAQESGSRNQKQSEQEALNIKVLLSNDLFLYKELFNRAMRNDSPEYKKAHKAFVQEMNDGNVEEEYYDPDNVYFLPAFMNGSSQMARIMNAEGNFNALMKQASTPGQELAQRDVVGAYVGYDNVEDYLPSKTEVDPVILKVGGENEDMDSPYVNAMNVPVLPTDKHMMEIPIHVADYEKKLQTAQGIIQTAQQEQNPFIRITLILTAEQIIVAQDTKGGHITGHIQAIANSKDNLQALEPVLEKFKQLQAAQDQMTQLCLKLRQEFSESMKTSDMNTEEVRHTQAMNQLAIDRETKMNDIAYAKALEQKQLASEKAQQKSGQDVEKKGLDLAFDEEKKKQELQAGELKLQQQKQKSNVSNTAAV